MISIICVWNNWEQYNNILLESLKKQKCRFDYELIGVDNRENLFSSCAAGLNWGGGIANGDVYIFVHQDISFASSDSLEQFIEFIVNHEKIIVGAYGAKRKEYKESYLCDTVDECCFGMTKKVYERLLFNEKLCDGWHLYAVEMCLRAKDSGIFSGYFNSNIQHVSGGNVDKDYMKLYKKLLKIYKHHRYIWTTCKKMPCNLLYYYFYYVFWLIKKKLIGNFPLVQTMKSLYRRVSKIGRN